MKLNMARLTIIAASLFTIWGVFLPWITFAGEIEHVLIGTYNISGYTFGVGFGSLDSSSASVSVWASEQFSSASSDFWFGYLPLLSGVIGLLLMLRFKKTEGFRIAALVVVGSSVASILACILAVFYYTPFVFVIHGQIDSLPINGAFLFSEDATISMGIGPLISAISTAVSSGAYMLTQRRMIKPAE
ncbi:MAG: hypothetical protein ACFFFC_16440 [Candidatus Thorarchaeota archaeon]